MKIELMLVTEPLNQESNTLVDLTGELIFQAGKFAREEAGSEKQRAHKATTDEIRVEILRRFGKLESELRAQQKELRDSRAELAAEEES